MLPRLSLIHSFLERRLSVSVPRTGGLVKGFALKCFKLKHF